MTTADTSHPSVSASSLHDLEQMALSTMQQIDHFLPEIKMIAGFTPYGGAIIQGVTMINPLIERALIFAMSETGKPFGSVLMDFISHITPGMTATKDSSVFNGPFQSSSNSGFGDTADEDPSRKGSG